MLSAFEAGPKSSPTWTADIARDAGMSGSKPVLFYSKFCRHSGDAVRAISARNLGGSIVMACVDGNTQRLPPWVDRVPLIFTHDRRVLSDESLLMYVASFSPTRALATSSSSAAGPGGIPGGDEPMAAESCNGASFTSFQNGDEDSTASAGAGGSPYLSIRNDGLDDFPRIVTPPDDSLRSTSSSSTGGGGGAPSYQPFQQQQQPPQQQQQQPTFQYNPNQFKPPPQPPGAVPGRGMVATVGGGAGGYGEPPPRMMPTLTQGGHGQMTIESMMAARDQDEARWAPPKQ